MRLPKFEYLTPDTLHDACRALEDYGSGSLALAGGTDLLVKMKHRRLLPKCLVNLKSIPGLDQVIHNEDKSLSIGALVTIQELKASTLVKREAKLLQQAANVMSSIQIRNCATIGGNLGNASPAGDGPLALLVSDASVKVRSTAGTRDVTIDELFLAPGKTILSQGELIESIRLPSTSPGTGVAYAKHALRRTDVAIVSTAVAVTVVDGRCLGVRIGLGSVAPTIMRAQAAEKVIAGQRADEDAIDAAAEAAANEAMPIDDIRGSARYRKQAVRETTRAALLKAVQDARMGGW